MGILEEGIEYLPSLSLTGLTLFSLSYYLFITVPLSISDLSIKKSIPLIPLVTPDSILSCQILTTELFNLNNGNSKDIKLSYYSFRK